MKLLRSHSLLAAALVLLAGCASTEAQSRNLKVCAECVKQTMEMLASPEMKGRGCGTEDEKKASGLLVDKLKAMGVTGAAPGGGFIQNATFTARNATSPTTTWNVLGKIAGSAPDADSHAVLLSAHYDHVGVRNGVVYPGANDDASGVAAVVEFARLLSSGEKPKRTVLIGLFGCEEGGLRGAGYYVANPPMPLTNIAVNLEFEMIGLPDPKHGKVLMLTGWERSNLGPALKARGARIQQDPYPEQNFFRRSDNYQLALKGVVAQTISAWPTPPTYHQPTDTIENLDLAFMAEVIQSLAEPIDWLVNSDFRPEWVPGGKPEPAPPRPPTTP